MPFGPPSERSPGMSRRTLLGLAAAGASAAMLAAAAPPRALASTPVQPQPQPATLEGFSLPTKATAPRFRWWWPNGEVDIEEIRREVQQVAENGFGGLEVANVHHSVPGELLDVENFGWGSPQWLAALEAALEAGDEHGVEIDVTLGPSWPAAIPTITPQDPAALVELVHGQIELVAGQQISGELPEPVVEAQGGVSGKQLLAVHAVQIAARGEKNVIVLRRSSLVDLTSTVSGTKIDWTAPDDGGEWILLAYWQRGMGQVAEGGPHTSPESYVVDHFSRAGADALIAYWEKNILNSKVRELLSRTGGTFFEDSLEIETHATIWTRAMQAEFSSRIGYDLMPFLPVLLEIDERYTFEFDDIKNHRVRDDFNLVLSQLYTDHHLVPLRDWSHSFGLEYRVQAYGLEQDSLEQAGIVDIIETESLGAKNLDDYRVLASGRDIAGRTIMSCEAAAYLGKSYSSTWNEVLNTLGETFAGGVNQTVLHGFAYAKAPGSQWPGFAAFTPYFNNAVGYSEAWGPRMPVWGHLNSAAEYLSRTQWVLRQGRPRYDVGFFRQKGWGQTGIGAPWATNAGIPTGWTHGFLNDSGLFLEGSTFTGGRFAPDGGAYKALVIDIDRFRGQEATMSVRGAKRLLELAKQGLPVVFFGDWSAPESIGYRDQAVNAEVAALVAEIRSLGNVRDAAGNDDIPVALSALGIRPTVSHDSSHLKHVHRVADGVEYFYFVNAKHNFGKDRLEYLEQEVRMTVSDGGRIPYQLDAWTGEVMPVAKYRTEGGEIIATIRLMPGQSTVFAVAAPGWSGLPVPSATIVSTSVRDARLTPSGELIVQSDSPGVHDVTLSTGITKRVRIAQAPGASELSDWQLVVDSWQPGADGQQTAHVEHRMNLSGLLPWSSIGGIEDVSGIGTYSSTFTLDKTWQPDSAGVVLSLGKVVDTFQVWVNSSLVAHRDLTDTDLDISDHVRAGRNTIRVEVASTLINSLRVFRPEVYGGVKRQDYGLIGPVTVTPHGRTRVAGCAATDPPPNRPLRPRRRRCPSHTQPSQHGGACCP